MQRQKITDQTIERVMRLASQGFYCSQILMCMALETTGGSNPELIRAMSGLASGCGVGQASCGVLTGAACLLGLYAGKGTPSDQGSSSLIPMLAELSQWFSAVAGGSEGEVSCRAILEAETRQTPQKKCASLVAGAVTKVMELLLSYGFDPSCREAAAEPQT
jgi:hypothetical protein